MNLNVHEQYIHTMWKQYTCTISAWWLRLNRRTFS